MTEPRTHRRWPRILLGVVVAIVVLVVIGVLALDRILLAQVRKQTDALSSELGRPITVEGVETKLLGGLGVKVTGLSIGPGPGEHVPLLVVPRAQVEVHLLRAIFSGGKVIEVGDAVVDGAQANVEKLADGTTNVERLSKALEERQARQPREARPAPEAEKGPADLSRIRIDRAAVQNARIGFIDRTVAGAKELAIDHLDVEVRDLRAGKPLEVVLRAAVLAPAQNLEARLKAAPLPPTLVPTPEQLSLEVKPIDLDPLAPFLPASVGFRGGRFAADLKVALGAAVKGGSGPTRVQGGFRATQLAFAGQQGGRKLDASLDADLQADADAGDLSIGKLELVVGPVTLSGHGRATGLTGDTPRVEGLEIVARNLDPAALEAYYPPLRKQLGGIIVAGPVGLSVRGSGTGAAQALELRVDLAPVRLVVPDQLAKPAGAPASLVARADAAQGGDRVRFDTALDLTGVDLRPGGTVAKKPGDPLTLRAVGTYRAHQGTRELALSRVDAAVLADRLTGTGQVTLAGTAPKRATRFTVEVSGPSLDLDRLLLPKPKGGKEAPPAQPKPANPEAYAGLSGVATAKLGTLRYHGVNAQNVLLQVRMDEDQVTLEQARLVAFGGQVSADGTQMRLAHPETPFKLVANLKGVDGGQALGLLSDHKILGGTLDAGIQLGGQGADRAALTKSLAGTLAGNLRGGAFYGKDLVASIAAPLAAKLPFAVAKVTEGGATPLGKELPFAFTIGGGAAKLQKPLRFDTGQGEMSLEGGVGLDGTLQMPATFALSPPLVARLTGGRAKIAEAIPVSFRLTGPAWSPRLEGLSLEAAAQAIVRQAATGAIGKALGIPGAGSPGEAAAKGQAEAEAKARQEAERARKQAEEEAKKRLRGLFGR